MNALLVLRRSAWIGALVLGLVACGSREGRTSAQAPAARSPSDPDSLAGLRLRIEATRDGQFALVAEAHGDGTVRVARALAIESQRGDRWTAIDARASFRPDCAHEAEPCITLVRGGSLRPPPWNGHTGDAQCECHACAPVPAGTYRFVVTTCDGSRRLASEAFVIENAATESRSTASTAGGPTSPPR